MSYDGATFEWTAGRRLARYSKGATTVEYKYNQDGIRTSKVVNGVATTYNLMGTSVISETTGSDKIVYRYNGEKLLAISIGNNEYYYVYNTQGDVVALVDANGNIKVTYTYDAWGNVTSTTDTSGTGLAEKNPYRYRGYRYDGETGLYYLQSRYYSPEWGRFVNFDDTAVVQGSSEKLLTTNGFAYGDNNPANTEDQCGHETYYNTIDAAAKAFCFKYNFYSIKANREYGAPIYEKIVNKKTKYFYGNFTKGTLKDKVSIVITTKKGLVAFAHTHAAYDKAYNSENFSGEDKKTAAKYCINGYLATPGGRFKRYLFMNNQTTDFKVSKLQHDYKSPDKSSSSHKGSQNSKCFYCL